MIPATTMHRLESQIELTPDFPEDGVLFRNISPLLERDFTLVTDVLGKILAINHDLDEIDMFGGLDARGFILAGALSQKFNKGMLMIRKDGKLPPPVHTESFDTEYAPRRIALQSGEGRVFVVDDVLATGGTLKAAGNLCEKAGYNVAGFMTLIDLAFLNDFRWNGHKCLSALRYEEPAQVLYPQSAVEKIPAFK
ncbi:MAG: adenine phosphoribosyltransferase [Pseudobdellovibrionaceae bacterium]